ncbi:MAG: 7TM diverse intracellular signaling domain-containing protein [Pseudomonadota bacterium]|nr:7TM diverse intracellular signaling domain-containing protein [Pseudomonadota bacterium]
MGSAWATTAIPAYDDSTRIVVTPYIQYLKTPQTLTIEDIEQIPARQFKSQGTAIFQGGFTSDTYWLKFTINDLRTSAEIKEWILAINSPVLSSVKFYSRNRSGQWALSSAGASERFLEREYKLRELVFPLATQPGETRTFYLAISSSTSVLAPIELWDKQAFIEHHGYDAYIWGAYFGILGAMLLYNLFLFFVIRDVAYFYYVGFGLFSSISMAALNGVGYQLLWPGYPDWNAITLSVVIPINFFFGAFFARAYLEMADVDKRLNRYLSYFGYLCLLPSAFSLVTGKPLNDVVTLAAFLFVILLVLSGIKALLAKKRQARFFLSAWALLFLTISLFSAGLFGLITLTPGLLYSIHIGIAAEVILLSLGLADRINTMKSERYAMQKQLTAISEERNQELIQSLKSKDEFLATISHEMRTPINGMLGAVTLLKRTGNETEQQKLLAAAEQAGQDMLGIVENLLSFTELQSGAISQQQETFEVLPLIKQLANKHRETYQNDQVNFIIENQLLEHCVHTDKGIVVRMLGAILDNAFKFTLQGQITVTLAQKDCAGTQQLVIDVTDTGIGIAKANIEKIFKPFYQVDQSFSRHFGGLGLGLSICSRLADLVNAKLEQTSIEGQGTTVSLALPVTFINTKAPDTTTSTNPDQPSREPDAPIRILIVEDNITNMMVTKGFISKLGYQYICAENGKEAVELMQREQADLILMDCQMPIMNGFEATKLIRQLGNANRDIPILAVTANAMLEDREKCLTAGMNDHIAKPIDSTLLHKKIEFWLQMQAD